MTKAVVQTTPVELSIKSLKLMSLQMGFDGSRINGKNKDHSSVLQGTWAYQCQRPGLSMHCGNFQELKDLSVSIELPVGLSFNIILDGTVSYSLAGQRYRLGSRTQTAECSCFALSQPELLTRQLSKGQQVYKVNIFVERQWLESRFGNDVEAVDLNILFEHHAQVNFWQPSKRALKITRQLLKSAPGSSLSEKLHYESKIIQLLSACLDDFMHQVKFNRLDHQQSIDCSQLCTRCKKFIDEDKTSSLSLQQIADSQNVSVSTLQRRFKASYGMTVIDYLRQKRMDKARTALVQDRLSIGEAAFLAGYNHPSNFISAFKKRFSLTPTDYRKIHSRSSSKIA